MDHIFLTGLTGAVTLLIGAAWPESKGKPFYSTKDWLFACGSVLMLVYALLNYFFGTGSVFFILLELLVLVSSVMMMLDLDDRIDDIVLSIAGIGFIAWSLFLYQGLNTIFFIVGLTGIGLGYTQKTGTIRRFTALTLGSLLIAVFSYLGGDWIFFWLNAFFALFSGYYLVKVVRKWMF